MVISILFDWNSVMICRRKLKIANFPKKDSYFAVKLRSQFAIFCSFFSNFFREPFFAKNFSSSHFSFFAKNDKLCSTNCGKNDPLSTGSWKGFQILIPIPKTGIEFITEYWYSRSQNGSFLGKMYSKITWTQKKWVQFHVLFPWM